MTTLAEKVRALKEKREAQSVAQKEYLDAFDGVPPDLRPEWMQDAYLRGHADALAEAKVEIDAHREQSQRLYARVKLLESSALDEHSRLAQEEARPAAVGVVVDDAMRSRVRHCQPQLSEQEIDRLLRHALISAQIVPLASAEPIAWHDDQYDLSSGASGVCDDREMAASHNTKTVSPLFIGIAQPAQERE